VWWKQGLVFAYLKGHGGVWGHGLVFGGKWGKICAGHFRNDGQWGVGELRGAKYENHIFGNKGVKVGGGGTGH